MYTIQMNIYSLSTITGEATEGTTILEPGERAWDFLGKEKDLIACESEWVWEMWRRVGVWGRSPPALPYCYVFWHMVNQT